MLPRRTVPRPSRNCRMNRSRERQEILLPGQACHGRLILDPPLQSVITPAASAFANGATLESASWPGLSRVRLLRKLRRERRVLILRDVPQVGFEKRVWQHLDFGSVRDLRDQGIRRPRGTPDVACGLVVDGHGGGILRLLVVGELQRARYIHSCVRSRGIGAVWRGCRLFRETRLKPLARRGWAAWVCSLTSVCPPRGFCLTAARLSQQALSSRAFVQNAVAVGTR